jgi:hypothetical protein
MKLILISLSSLLLNKEKKQRFEDGGFVNVLLKRITNLCSEQFSQTDINKEKFPQGIFLSLAIILYNHLSPQRPNIEITSTTYSRVPTHHATMGNSASVCIAPGTLSKLGPRFLHSDFNSVYQTKYPKATPEELDMMFSYSIDVGACEEVWYGIYKPLPGQKPATTEEIIEGFSRRMEEIEKSKGARPGKSKN